MGFSLAWVGVRRRRKQHLLADLGLRDTGKRSELGEEDLVGLPMPGWYIVVSNHARHFDYGCAEALSKGGEAICCAVEDGTGFAVAECFRNGREVWTVVIDADEPEAIEIRGRLPPGADELIEEARENDPDAEVGLTDVPIEIAHMVTGFRHDGGYECDAPFEILEPAPPDNRGRALVGLVIAIALGSSAIVSMLTPGDAAVGLGRLVLTAGMCWWLYQGYAWARWVFVVLFAAGAIIGLAAGGLWPLLLVATYVACLAVLLTRPVGEFLRVQERRRRSIDVA
ncbi:MAG: hypothetical protein ACYTHK_12520 [Planctomycetota bacterium]|jgi:hypothetical protein